MKTAAKMMKSVESLEKQFSDLAQEIYERGERRIAPSYPWILVRVVPKEQKVGHIIMSENAGNKEQNKPLYEAIVLKTWKPFVQDYCAFEDDSVQYHKQMTSEFIPGDRVLFPHHSGLPINFLDERKYRLVREVTGDPIGGAMCILHYDGDNKYKEVLDELFADAHSITMSGR